MAKGKKEKQMAGSKGSQKAQVSSLLSRFNAWIERKSNFLFWFTFILSVLFSFLLFNARISEGGDDSTYIQAGYNYAQGFFDYYFGFNAPLYPMFLALPIAIFGINLIALKIISVIFHLLHIYFLFKVFDKRAPSVIVYPVLFLTAINSFYLYFASQTYNEAMYVFLQAMVFFAFILVFFREGMSPLLLLLLFLAVLLFLLTLLINNNMLIIGIIILGLLFAGVYARNWQRGLVILAGAVMAIGLVVSVDFVLNDVLCDHQRKRVMLLVNPNADPLGVGWNTTQSKIAIGSGGFSGKGFLEGTQTKFDFVPEQTTDFIFCTIGEEQGWIGSTLLLVAFTLLLLRIIAIAERQKSTFVRVYGYAVVAIIFFHFSINIAMTIGLFPVIGIPLPFFSYGGSSLWSFTILLFILLKLDAHRMEMLQRF